MRVFERAFRDRYVAFRSNNAHGVPTVCLTDYSLSSRLQRAPRADISIDRRVAATFAKDVRPFVKIELRRRQRCHCDFFNAGFRLPFTLTHEPIRVLAKCQSASTCGPVERKRNFTFAIE